RRDSALLATAVRGQRSKGIEVGGAMELSLLRHVYDQEGPFATVYLEGRSPSEDAGTQTRLRWQALREQLLSDGAPEDIVQAIKNELGQATAGEEQGNGRVLVANSSGVLLNEPFDVAQGRSEERRVGKEGRAGRWREQENEQT